MFNMSLGIRVNQMTKPLLCVAVALVLGACSSHSMEKTEIPSSKPAEPALATSKPKGWDSDNVFLGRWQGNSTAGRAVLEVLTVAPNRVRWGNAANGICDSDYSVEHLP